MAELSKRIQAAHGHHGGTSHHQNQQQQQQQIVERYKELSASSDDPSNIPKPLSVDYIFFTLLTYTKYFHN